MPQRYVVKVLDATAPLASLQKAIRQTEELGFTAVSVAIGMVDGKRANVVTFQNANPPSQTITLVTVDGSHSDAQQSDDVTDAADGKTFVAYAGVFVGGQPTNVLMVRG